VTVNRLMEAAGLRLKGHIVLSPVNGEYAFMDRQGTTVTSGKIQPVLVNNRYDVPVLERSLEGETPNLMGDYKGGLTNPELALEVLKKVSKGKSGILITDTHLRPMEFVPMPLRQLGALSKAEKGASPASRIMKAVDKLNVGTRFIVYSKGTVPINFSEKISNLQKFAKATGTQLVDVILDNGTSYNTEGYLNRIVVDNTFLEQAKGPIPENERADIRQELVDYFGEEAVKALEDAGILRIVTPEEALGLVKPFGKRKDIQLVLDGKARIPGMHLNGTIFQVDGWMRKGRAVPNLLHEIGVHLNRLGITKDSQFEKLLKVLEKRMNANTKEGELLRQAWEKVPQGTPENKKLEELLAYLVGDKAVNVSAVRRFIAMVKKFLVNKLGINPAIFSVDDLRAIAQSAIKGAGKIYKTIINLRIAQSPFMNGYIHFLKRGTI